MNNYQDLTNIFNQYIRYTETSNTLMREMVQIQSSQNQTIHQMIQHLYPNEHSSNYFMNSAPLNPSPLQQNSNQTFQQNQTEPNRNLFQIQPRSRSITRRRFLNRLRNNRVTNDALNDIRIVFTNHQGNIETSPNLFELSDQIINTLFDEFQQNVQSNGLTNNQIQEFTTETRYGNIIHPLNHECPIMQQTFTDDDIVIRINHCNHIFMKEGILHWLEISKLCPLCRCDITTTENNTEPLREVRIDMPNENQYNERQIENNNEREIENNNDMPNETSYTEERRENDNVNMDWTSLSNENNIHLLSNVFTNVLSSNRNEDVSFGQISSNIINNLANSMQNYLRENQQGTQNEYMNSTNEYSPFQFGSRIPGFDISFQVII